MSVLLYKGAKYRTLAGKKIFRNGKWIELPASAKMYLDGQWYPLGRTVPGSSIPDIPDMPEVPEITHINGEEPSGKKWYISPAGAGAQDGSSWSNAAPVSDIHIIMLQAVSGDSVYLMEGSYTTNRVISVPEGVNFYGGFSAENPQWSTRNGFDTPTVFTGTADFIFVAPATRETPFTLDGVSLSVYQGVASYGTDMDHPNQVTIRNARLYQVAECRCMAFSHIIVDRGDYVCGETAEFCNCSNVSQILRIGTLSDCYCAKLSCLASVLQRCILVDCSTNSRTSKTYSDSFFYKGSGDIAPKTENCLFCDMKLAPSFSTGGTLLDSVVYNCTVIASTTRKTFIPSSERSYFVECLITGEYLTSNTYEISLLGSSQKDTLVNCVCEYKYFSFIRNSTGASTANCTKMYNCSVSGNNAYIMTANPVSNCLFVNCEAQQSYLVANRVNSSYNKGYIYDCTFVNCKANAAVAISNGVGNSLSFNNATNSGEFTADAYGGCACSLYGGGNVITLGYDNTIARFTATGYFPARGVQDVGKCPNPATDRAGFDAYIAAFGDWRPLSNSFLVGHGYTIPDITTDLDGVARPDPPTIGAYEPKPE